MARLTVRKINKMSLGEALRAQSLTDWDQAHIASHARMRSAGLGAAERLGTRVASGASTIQSSTLPVAETKAPAAAPSSIPSSSTSPSKIAQLVTPVNQALSPILTTLGPWIDLQIPADPPYYPGFKADLKRVPVDALVKLFQPLDNFFYDVVNNANAVSSVKAGDKRMVGMPGHQVEFVMGLDVPTTLDSYAKDYTKRLKAINNVLILSYQDPASLAKGIVKTIIDDVNAGKMEAKEAVGNLVAFLKNASATGVNLRGLSGPESVGIPKPDDRFFKAISKEIRDNLNNLPASMKSILEGALKVVTDASEVAGFFINYFYFLFRHIGVGYPGVPTVPGLNIGFPFNYWAAAARINKDNGDGGVHWEIWQFRGQNDGQDNGRKDFQEGKPQRTLRSMQLKGDSQGWNGPVYNSVLRAMLEQVNSDLNRIQDVASDMAGRKKNGYPLVGPDMSKTIIGRVFASYNNNPQYPAPSLILENPQAASYVFLFNYIRDSMGMGAVADKIRSAISDSISALGSQMPFPIPNINLSNVRIPGLSGVPMDAYTFKGMGLFVADDAALAAGLSLSGGTYGGAGVGNGGTAAGGTGVATSPATTPEISKLINQILGMYTGGAVQMPTPPTITVQPQSVTAAEGTKATFSVTATAAGGGGMSIPGVPTGGAAGGAPAALTYQWSKNGVPIANATSSSLIVDAVTADSGSVYTVTVGTGGAPAAMGGAAGSTSVVSKGATLTVTPKQAEGGGGGGGADTSTGKSNILPIILGAGAVAALPVAGPVAALALAAGAAATALSKKPAAAPVAPSKPLSGYAGIYGYLGASSAIQQAQQASGAMNVPTVDMIKKQTAPVVEEKKDNTTLYVAGGLSVAGLIIAAAYRKKK